MSQSSSVQGHNRNSRVHKLFCRFVTLMVSRTKKKIF